MLFRTCECCLVQIMRLLRYLGKVHHFTPLILAIFYLPMVQNALCPDNLMNLYKIASNMKLDLPISRSKHLLSNMNEFSGYFEINKATFI